MNKWQALDYFWNQFNIPAYDEGSVPDNAVMPYITYKASVNEFEKATPLYASIWYKSTSWMEISLKADAIAEWINSHRLIKLDDDQYLYIAQGDPFAQRMQDENSTVKRIYINIMAEYFSRK